MGWIRKSSLFTRSLDAHLPSLLTKPEKVFLLWIVTWLERRRRSNNS